MRNLFIILMLTFSSVAMASHFETNSSRPTEELIYELKNLYNLKIKGHRVYEITVEGHTDSRGSKLYNLKLSKSRAKAAFLELKKMGLKADKVNIIGRGEDFPISKGLNPLDFSKNRRVVISIKSDKGKSKTVISECKVKTRVVVKEKSVYKKNSLKLFLGYGPNDLKKGINRVDLDSDPFVGIGYQRMLNEDFSIEVIGNTNKSLMLGGGIHF